MNRGNLNLTLECMGLNEHANGLLRRLFPKGSNFYQTSSNKVIQKTVKKLSHLSRKCLNLRTTYEVPFKTKVAALST